MNAQFTTKSQEALSAANMNAQTAGNPTLDTSHLLKALMDQREGVAVAVLKTAGLDVDAISLAASTEISKLPKVQGASAAQAQPSRAFLTAIQTAQTKTPTSPPKSCCWRSQRGTTLPPASYSRPGPPKRPLKTPFRP